MKDLGANAFSYGYASPVLMAATYNDDGTVNVMNLHEVARTNAGDLACCIGKPKKTHKNIEKRKAFTLAFEPLPARYHRNNKSGIPFKGIPDLLLSLPYKKDFFGKNTSGT